MGREQIPRTQDWLGCGDNGWTEGKTGKNRHVHTKLHVSEVSRNSVSLKISKDKKLNNVMNEP